MSRRWWQAYLAVATVAVAGYQFLPDGLWLPAGYQVGIAYLAALAALLGARPLPRAERPVWVLVACGVALNASGILANAYLRSHDPDAGQPNIADPFFLSIYVFAGLALALSLRLHPPRFRWPAVLDSATVTSGIGLLIWIYAIDPAIEDTWTPMAGRIVRVLYPIGDIALLALAAVLVRSGRGARRGGSAPLLLVGTMLFLAGDMIWLVVGTLGVELNPALSRGVDSVFLAAFVSLGAATRGAATGPDPEAPEDGDGGMSLHLGIAGLASSLGAALLIAPALLLATHGDGADTVVVAVGSAITSVLVVTRMALLLAASERQASYVRELSRRDDLTGLPNRRAWNAALARALPTARGDGRPVSIAMLDLDRFKLFNDTFGHPAGDRLLKEATAAWSATLRSTDILARYGGEEFIVLLPGADLGHAGAVLDRARAVTPSGQTFSAGVATWDGTETADDLIARADIALYAAKAAGRDRIESAGLRPSPEISRPNRP